MNWQDFIEANPRIMFGKPVIKGTRITVEHLLEELAHGMTLEDLRRGHPRLRSEHVQAALQFAADHPDEFQQYT
jgi:uncharacterized protein (DUF433 family)